jgi:HEAT repeat protein
MSDDRSDAYRLSKYRRLLLDRFTSNPDDLRRLFFYTANPNLRPLYNQLTKWDSLEDLIAKILEYCQQRELLPDLLHEVEKAPILPLLSPEERQTLERRYLDRVAGKWRTLETPEIDRVQAELKDVFVMLEAVQRPSPEVDTDIAPFPEREQEMGLVEQFLPSTGRRQAGRREVERSMQASADSPPPVPLSQALREHMHLMILGEPGTGKTTTLQFVGLCFAHDGWAQERLGLDEQRVPVRAELRAYSGAHPLGGFLVGVVASEAQFDPLSSEESRDKAEPLLRTWLREGQLVVLLDGLDEVPEVRRDAVLEAIEAFAATPEGRRCRLIVTSRIAGYREVRRGLRGEFGQYTIRPFAGPQDALPYVRGWLRALVPVSEQAEMKAQNLLDAMERRSGLRRVMGNPLQLRLAVAVYTGTGELAGNRSELYRRYLDEVNWKRAEARGKPPWSRREIESALDVAAWTLQTRGSQAVSELAKAVASQVENVRDGSALLDYLREEMGLLAVYGYERGERLAFRYRSFQEHLVAERLKQDWDRDRKRLWQFLHPRLHHPDWREPILLLAGQLDERGASGLVRRILEARSAYDRELHRDLLLAAAVLSDGASVAPEVASRVTDALTHLSLDLNPWWWLGLAGRLLALMLLYIVYWQVATRVLHLEEWWSYWLPLLGLAMLWSVGLSLLPGVKATLQFLDRLIGRVVHPSLYLRVLDALARLPEPQRAQAAEALIRALGDRRGQTRWKAAVALRKLDQPQAVQPLIKALGDSEESVRRHAAGALGALGDSCAVEPLLELLSDESTVVRTSAADALGNIGEPEAIEPLIETLADESETVRVATAMALGGFGELRAAGPLIEAMLGESETVCRAAAWALQKISEPKDVSVLEHLVRQLEDGEPDIRWFAADTLQKIGDPVAVIPLTQALHDPSEQVRQVAARALGKLGDARAVDSLVETLVDPEPYIRWAVADALGKIGSPRAVPSLLESLEDSHELVRWAAAWALGRLGEPRALEPLRQMLQHENPDVRRAAAEGLGGLGKQSSALLIQALGDREAEVRRAAVVSMGREGTVQEVESLLRLLGDESEQVRQAAARVLVKLDQPTVEPLIQALGHHDARVRQMAAHALRDMPHRIERGGLARDAARRLWRHLTDEAQVSLAAREALDAIVPRLTELEVAELPVDPVPLATCHEAVGS